MPAPPYTPHRIDRLALEFVSGEGLPDYFACWKSNEAVLSGVKKGELQERACQLGANPLTIQRQTPAQILKSIASILISLGVIPDHMVSLKLLASQIAAHEQLRCWKCGSPITISVDTLVDFKIGLWIRPRALPAVGSNRPLIQPSSHS